MSKYPGLAIAAKAHGIAYMTAYQRMNHGWSFERATTEPTNRTKVKLCRRVLAERDNTILPWERVGYIPVTSNRGRKIKQMGGAKANDTSPPRIRKIRAAFCNEFIKTGVINTDLQNQLRVYADECRAANHNSDRVSADPAAVGDRGPSTDHGDNRLRDVDQTGREIAERVYDYLRAG